MRNSAASAGFNSPKKSIASDAFSEGALVVAAEQAIGAAKVGPAPAKAIAIGVEAIGTVVETASDVIDNCQSTDSC